MLKAITLTQPWASLLAIGAKIYETRSWPTSHRGPLAIHAAKGWTRHDRNLCGEEPFRKALHAAGLYTASVHTSRGHLLAVVDVIACAPITAHALPAQPLIGDWAGPAEHELDFGGYAPDRYAWVTANRRRLREPIMATGHLGLWPLLPEDEAAVIDQIGVANPCG